MILLQLLECHKVMLLLRTGVIGSERVADVMLDQQSVMMALRAPRGSKTLAGKVQ